MYIQIVTTFYISHNFLVQNAYEYTALCLQEKRQTHVYNTVGKYPTVVNYLHTLSTNWNVTVVSINPKVAKNKAGGGSWART